MINNYVMWSRKMCFIYEKLIDIFLVSILKLRYILSYLIETTE